MPPTDAELELTEALYRASASPHGVAYATSDATQAIALAFRVRSSLGDPSLASLRFVRGATQANELWIVRDEPQTRVTPPPTPLTSTEVLNEMEPPE
jgi:hypothetical protein